MAMVMMLAAELEAELADDKILVADGALRDQYREGEKAGSRR